MNRQSLVMPTSPRNKKISRRTRRVLVDKNQSPTRPATSTRGIDHLALFFSGTDRQLAGWVQLCSQIGASERQNS